MLPTVQEHRPSRWRARVGAVAASCLSLAASGCSQTTALSALSGVLGASGNYSLRRDLLSIATATLCREVQAQSLALRLRDGDPALGRFYPSRCVAVEQADRRLRIEFGGVGVVWTNLTHRLAFDASATAQFDLDYDVSGGVVRVYFQTVDVSAPSLAPRFAERTAAQAAASVVGMPRIAQLTSALFEHELWRGFTVFRDGNDATWLRLGKASDAERPPLGFANEGSHLVVNERVEIHEGQRDYVGPIALDGPTTIHVAVEGAPAIDLVLVPRPSADAWLGSYLTQPGPAPLRGEFMVAEAVTATNGYHRSMTLPRGEYFLVLDHTATAGPTAPPGRFGDDRFATVSVAVER